MRTSADECEFANFLPKVGNGEYFSTDDGLVELHTPLISNVDIVSKIYGQHFLKLRTFQDVQFWHPRMSIVTKLIRGF